MANRALLDANVLYPAPLRDLLLRLAAEGLFVPHWTDEIHEEWTRSLMAKRPDLTRERLGATISHMERAFPGARVPRYRNLMKGLSLPDPDDGHVLAAALAAKAGIIITFNTRDFPENVLRPLHVKAVHPDGFVLSLYRAHPAQVVAAVRAQRAALRRPIVSAAELLVTLEQQGLPRTAELLKGNLERL